MTVDLSEFRELNRTPGCACAPAAFIASLEPHEQEQLLAAFADVTIQSAAIHRWMEKRGYQRRADGVRKHRTGSCSCGRS